MGRQRVQRWGRPSCTRANPYVLMINSSRVFTLRNGEYGVRDASICETMDKASTHLSGECVYDFIHKSIGNVANMRMLSRLRQHPLNLTRLNAGATDVVVIPYRYRGTLEIALITGVCTMFSGQNRAMNISIVSGSPSLKIRRFRQLKRLIAHEFRSRMSVQNVSRHDFHLVERCIGIRGSCKNDVDVVFTACVFISRIRNARNTTLDHAFVRYIEPSWFEISRFRAFLLGSEDPMRCFVLDIKTQDVLAIRKPIGNSTRNPSRWTLSRRHGPNFSTHHSLTHSLTH